MTRPRIAHVAQYAALRGAIGALGLLPLERAGSLGERLGALGYRPLGLRRAVAERQVAAAFPGLPPEESARIARASFEHLGRATVEAALLSGAPRERVLDMVEAVDGWATLESALARGSGCILVTGHLGNWELGGAYLAARGVPIDVIVRSMSNPLFDRYLSESRARTGVVLVREPDAVRRTPRSLREGRCMVMLADQGVLGLASTFVPFFGRPAKTPRGPAVFALRMKVPLVFGVALRQPSGRYRLSFEPVTVEDTGHRERDVEVIVRQYTKVLERWVRRAPEQYFWQHRRWKRQPAGTPADLLEP